MEETEEIQKIMLEMLKCIHEICLKNDLAYWLHGGTLLGCIRSEGFIPWDDDCDIAMPRRDYEKFLVIGQRLLPEGMFLQTKGTDKFYPHNFAKVRRLGTKIVELGEQENEKYCQGVFVDIFPFDYYPYKWFVRWMRWSVRFRDKRKKYKKGSVKRLLVTIYTNILMFLPVFISRKIRKVLSHFRKQLFADENYRFLTNGLECGGTPNVTPRSIILPLAAAKFAGYTFNVPRDSNEYLAIQYGESWRKLPPLAERKINAKNICLNYKNIYMVENPNKK